MASSPLTTLNLVQKFLDDNLAEDIVTLNVTTRTAYTDFMVIATGRSSRHIITLAEKLVAALKQAGARDVRREGQDAGEWLIVDAGGVMVHLFLAETREHYQLERLWGPHSDHSGSITPRAVMIS